MVMRRVHKSTVRKTIRNNAPADAADAADMADEAWAVLSESLVIREQLSYACAEVKVAIDAIRARLDLLGVKILDASDDESQPADELLRRRA
jgi:hypothetical protein